MNVPPRPSPAFFFLMRLRRTVSYMVRSLPVEDRPVDFHRWEIAAGPSEVSLIFIFLSALRADSNPF